MSVQRLQRRRLRPGIHNRDEHSFVRNLERIQAEKVRDRARFLRDGNFGFRELDSPGGAMDRLIQHRGNTASRGIA
jgi:hypothetical protein